MNRAFQWLILGLVAALALGLGTPAQAEAIPPMPQHAWLFDGDLVPLVGTATNGVLEGNAAHDPTEVPFAYAGNQSVDIGGAGGGNTHASRVNFTTDLGGAFEDEEALTISMWIKSNKINADMGFLSLREPSGGDEWGMRYDSKDWLEDNAAGDNIIKAAITTTDSQQWAGSKPRYDQSENQYSSAKAVQTTGWQHVVMVFQGDGDTGDGDDSFFTLYLDGVLDTPSHAMQETSGLVDETTHFLLGDGGKADWDGYVDEVAVWTSALTAENAEWLHNHSLQEIPEPGTFVLLAMAGLGLLIWWRR